VKIEEHKCYLDGLGDARGPMRRMQHVPLSEPHHWICTSTFLTYTDDGRRNAGRDNPMDLTDQEVPAETDSDLLKLRGELKVTGTVNGNSGSFSTTEGTRADPVQQAELVIEDGVVVKDKDGEAGRPATTEDYQAADIVKIKPEDLAGSSLARPTDVLVTGHFGPGGAGGATMVEGQPAAATTKTAEPEPASKRDILEEAIAVVGGRGKSYGRPEDNFGRIARLWNAHIENRYRDPENDFATCLPQLDAQDVSMMMALMKIARLENDPDHHDSWVDVAGYAACGGELAAYHRAAE
jgi:hypothetical protein